MKLTNDTNVDDNTMTEGETPLISVLTSEVYVRTTSRFDGALCFTGWVTFGDTLFTYIWNNCSDSVSERLTMLVRKVGEREWGVEWVEENWIYEFIPVTAQGNMVKVGIDCMLNDMREFCNTPNDPYSWKASAFNAGDFCV